MFRNAFKHPNGSNVLRSLPMNFKCQRTSVDRRKHTKAKHYTRKQPAAPPRMRRLWHHFQPIDGQGGTEPPASSNLPQYTLLSYNILAQDLLVEHAHLYYNVDSKWLRWEHRLLKLSQEIAFIQPDILCLQEMQYNHLKGFVKSIRGDRQLEYVFKKKTGHRTDGCAIIYDRSKFNLLDDSGLEYHTSNARHLDRENVALMAKFRLRLEPSKVFVVCTTHLLYNPKRSDVRCAQVDKLLAHLDVFASAGKQAEPPTLPVIATGDFNCTPYSPPFCRLITPPVDRCQPEGVALVPLHFGEQENIASTFQDEWIVVDYVMGTPQTIRVNSVYRLPTIMECLQSGGLPSKHLGSDHLSLAIRFSVS